MTDVQLALFQQKVQLRKGDPSLVVFAEMAKASRLWWGQNLRVMQVSSSMPNSSLHTDGLTHDIADAMLHPFGGD